MMACLRLNTPESYKKATEIYNGLDDKFQIYARIAHPYALLAHLQGDTVEAYEAVARVRSRTVIKTGLLVTFLTKLNRFNDAFRALELVIKEAQTSDSPLGRRGQKVIFSLETVRALTEAVEAVEDKALHVKLARIYKNLDSVAAISEQSLVDIVAGPIDVTSGMKYKRQKNRAVRQMRNETLFDVDELDEESEDFENKIYDK